MKTISHCHHDKRLANQMTMLLFIFSVSSSYQIGVISWGGVGVCVCVCVCVWGGGGGISWHRQLGQYKPTCKANCITSQEQTMVCRAVEKYGQCNLACIPSNDEIGRYVFKQCVNAYLLIS